MGVTIDPGSAWYSDGFSANAVKYFTSDYRASQAEVQ
jgi:hypothetical protein